MAKFVCDFEQVRSVGEKLTSMANDLQSGISNYSSKINGDLSAWTGTAKNVFMQQCDAQVSQASSNAQSVANLGEFIINAAQSISDLETKLSNLSI